MRPRETRRAEQFDSALKTFDSDVRRLPGIAETATRQAFLEQLVESVRRVDFIGAISRRSVSMLRADPTSSIFDPIRAARLHQQAGRIDEACWLVFLSVHFGKNRRTGWVLARDVYGGLGCDTWDWERTSSNPSTFRSWLANSQTRLKQTGHFGNHRKYQSLDAYKPVGTGAAIESYVRWIKPPRTHAMLFDEARRQAGANRRMMFDWLYRSMGSVVSFGRTGRFDYLTMLGKLELAPIEPGSTYMTGATGPLDGARLLFGKKPAVGQLDNWLVQLGDHLGVSMQVIEDALCNWQKSPDAFEGFRG